MKLITLLKFVFLELALSIAITTSSHAESWEMLTDSQGRSLVVKLVDIQGAKVKVMLKKNRKSVQLDYPKLDKASQKLVVAWGKENIAEGIEDELSGKAVAKRPEVGVRGSDRKTI